MTENREEYGDYSVDDEDQPGAEGAAAGGPPDPRTDADDPLDAGYSPPEKYSAGQGYGNTPWEEEHRETIDQRLGQEIPEPDPYDEAAVEAGDATEADEYAQDPEAGSDRAGRLVDPDQGSGPDEEKDLVGQDVGIDGAGASAEEAAMHVVDEDDL
ncbi:MAG TPA: DUF5709 domain-containing protein [Nocardioides sp.]|uniref:DUF5709 domain-containing protein n=1 Tax=Nocardioides sp. TaxID=35761 RepID=UPI002EDA3709